MSREADRISAHGVAMQGDGTALPDGSIRQHLYLKQIVSIEKAIESKEAKA
jgi:hypothetical protein